MSKKRAPDIGARELEANVHLKRARKVLFERIELTVGGVTRKASRMEHYTRRLADGAAANRRSEHREIRQLRTILGPRPSELAPPQNEAHKLRVEKQLRLRKLVYKHYWFDTLSHWREVNEKFEEVHGKLADVSRVLPRHDPELHVSFEAFQKRFIGARRKRAKGKPYVVGRNKPPASARFLPGQSGNAAGRPKQKNFLEDLEANLSHKIVAKKADGSEIRITREEAAIVQMYNSAMKGKAGAQKDLRALIQELHSHDMLSPKPRPQQRSRWPEADKRVLQNLFITVRSYGFKDYLVEGFSHAYGPVPAFTTSYERSLPKISDIEGLTDFRERHPELEATIKGLEELYANRFIGDGNASPSRSPLSDLPPLTSYAFDDYEWLAKQDASRAQGQSDPSTGQITDEDRARDVAEKEPPSPPVPTRKRLRATPPAGGAVGEDAASSDPGIKAGRPREKTT